MQFPAFVQSVTAEPWWDEQTSEYDYERSVYEVAFIISPARDSRPERNPYVMRTQPVTVFYNEPPPFAAGDIVPFVVEDGVAVEPRREVEIG